MDIDFRSTVLFIHVTAVFCAFAGILYADRLAFSWIRGKKHVLDAKLLQRTHWFMSVALALFIGSGLLLFWPVRSYLLQSTPFFIKMGFVGTLIVNSFVIARLMPLATQKSFKELTLKEKTPLFLSGAVSTLCWVGAAITALFLF